MRSAHTIRRYASSHAVIRKACQLAAIVALVTVPLLVVRSPTTFWNVHFSDASLKENDSKITAICFAGAIGQLSEPRAQSNMRNYLADALNATVFMHIDLSFDKGAVSKEIFRPPTITDSEVRAMLRRTRTHTFQSKREESGKRTDFISSNCTNLDRSNSWRSRDWIIDSGLKTKQYFEHLKQCSRQIMDHEKARGKRYSWILLSRTDNFFLPSILEKPEEATVYVDIHGSGSKYEIKGRIMLLPREHLEQVTHFVDTLESLQCSPLNVSYCSRPDTPECLITWFFTVHFPGRIASLSHIGLRWIPSRMCGSWELCKAEARNMVTLCKRRNDTLPRECKYVDHMRDYYSV